METKKELVMLGVPGVLTQVRVESMDAKGLWKKQKWLSTRRTKTVDGEKILLEVAVRFDDQCGNRHNTFAITASGWYDHFKSRDIDFGGCCHELIAKVFPELAPLIKWHLVDTGSPMHYVANTVYHASNLYNGKAKGEPNAWENRIKFDNFPIGLDLPTSFITWLVQQHKAGAPLIIKSVPYVKRSDSERDYDPQFTFDGWDKTWGGAPFKSLQHATEVREALMEHKWEVVSEVTGWSPGKERNLDAARSTACWPEATDEQLMLPAAELTALLEARLPSLQEDFKAAVVGAGLEWAPTV